MKKLLIGFLAMANLSNAAECVDLSGKYKINFEEDCSHKTVRKLRRISGKYLVLHRPGTYSALTDIPDDMKEVELEIKQQGCEKLDVTVFGRDYKGNPDTETYEYPIRQKNIQEAGFKFTETSFSIEYMVPDLTREKFSIKQKVHGSNEVLHIKTFEKSWMIIFLIIPGFLNENPLSCDLHEI